MKRVNSFEKEGEGILIFTNGDKYKGTWVHNVLQSQVTIEYANGDQYEGEINVENLQKHGKGVLTLKNGDVYGGTWVNDNQTDIDDSKAQDSSHAEIDENP